jgi:sarcosine oxidase subunit beta
MVVDIRKVPGSSNYYFYQNEEGQVIFCITPDPQIWGEDTRETSEFLPMVATRLLELYPRLSNLKVRRTWRGCYPNSPDGSPFIDQAGPENFYLAIGMSGQGFMLGPGVGKLLARLLTGEATDKDRAVLKPLRVDRVYASQEALK